MVKSVRMRVCARLFCWLLLASCVGASGLASVLAKASAVALAKVFAGPDGLAHVTDGSGHDKSFPKEKGQVSVGKMKLAEDRSAAGWTIEEENCCTSYPIPTRLAVYSGSKKRIIAPGLMIWDWCFVDGGAKVAIASGTVHCMDTPELTLFSTQSGRQIEDVSDLSREKDPDWAACLSH